MTTAHLHEFLALPLLPDKVEDELTPLASRLKQLEYSNDVYLKDALTEYFSEKLRNSRFSEELEEDLDDDQLSGDPKVSLTFNISKVVACFLLTVKEVSLGAEERRKATEDLLTIIILSFEAAIDDAQKRIEIEAKRLPGQMNLGYFDSYYNPEDSPSTSPRRWLFKIIDRLPGQSTKKCDHYYRLKDALIFRNLPICAWATFDDHLKLTSRNGSGEILRNISTIIPKRLRDGQAYISEMYAKWSSYKQNESIPKDQWFLQFIRLTTKSYITLGFRTFGPHNSAKGGPLSRTGGSRSGGRTPFSSARHSALKSGSLSGLKRTSGNRSRVSEETQTSHLSKDLYSETITSDTTKDEFLNICFSSGLMEILHPDVDVKLYQELFSNNKRFLDDYITYGQTQKTERIKIRRLVQSGALKLSFDNVHSLGKFPFILFDEHIDALKLSSSPTFLTKAVSKELRQAVWGKALAVQSLLFHTFDFKTEVSMREFHADVMDRKRPSGVSESVMKDHLLMLQSIPEPLNLIKTFETYYDYLKKYFSNVVISENPLNDAILFDKAFDREELTLDGKTDLPVEDKNDGLPCFSLSGASATGQSMLSLEMLNCIDIEIIQDLEGVHDAFQDIRFSRIISFAYRGSLLNANSSYCIKETPTLLAVSIPKTKGFKVYLFDIKTLTNNDDDPGATKDENQQHRKVGNIKNGDVFYSSLLKILKSAKDKKPNRHLLFGSYWNKANKALRNDASERYKQTGWSFKSVVLEIWPYLQYHYKGRILNRIDPSLRGGDYVAELKGLSDKTIIRQKSLALDLLSRKLFNKELPIKSKSVLDWDFRPLRHNSVEAICIESLLIMRSAIVFTDPTYELGFPYIKPSEVIVKDIAKKCVSSLSKYQTNRSCANCKSSNWINATRSPEDDDDDHPFFKICIQCGEEYDVFGWDHQDVEDPLADTDDLGVQIKNNSEQKDQILKKYNLFQMKHIKNQISFVNELYYHVEKRKRLILCTPRIPNGVGGIPIQNCENMELFAERLRSLGLDVVGFNPMEVLSELEMKNADLMETNMVDLMLQYLMSITDHDSDLFRRIIIVDSPGQLFGPKSLEMTPNKLHSMKRLRWLDQNGEPADHFNIFIEKSYLSQKIKQSDSLIKAVRDLMYVLDIDLDPIRHNPMDVKRCFKCNKKESCDHDRKEFTLIIEDGVHETQNQVRSSLQVILRSLKRLKEELADFSRENKTMYDDMW